MDVFLNGHAEGGSVGVIPIVSPWILELKMKYLFLFADVNRGVILKVSTFTVAKLHQVRALSVVCRPPLPLLYLENHCF